MKQMQRELRIQGYRSRTHEAYLSWVRRFASFHESSPQAHSTGAVASFMQTLVANGISASGRQQALAALSFLYSHVLHIAFPEASQLAEEKKNKRLPLVIDDAQAQLLLNQLKGTSRRMAELLYGAGLRLEECVFLRVQDLDFDRGEVAIRQLARSRRRVVPMPDFAREALAQHVEQLRQQHATEVASNGGWVELSETESRGMPWSREWLWQWAFPAQRRYRGPGSGEYYHRHAFPSALQRAVNAAGVAVGMPMRVTCATLRHSYAMRLLEAGHDLLAIQRLLGNRSLATTMVYSQIAAQSSEPGD